MLSLNPPNDHYKKAVDLINNKSILAYPEKNVTENPRTTDQWTAVWKINLCEYVDKKKLRCDRYPRIYIAKFNTHFEGESSYAFYESGSYTIQEQYFRINQVKWCLRGHVIYQRDTISNIAVPNIGIQVQNIVICVILSILPIII